MGRVRRTPTSRKDLRELWFYIADRNPAAADAQLRLIEERLLFLSENPRTGPRAPGIAAATP